MSLELAYILGVIFGGGFNYGGRRKSWCTGLNVIDKDFRDCFAATIEKWSGKKPYIAEGFKRDILYYICVLYSKEVGEFILSYRERKDIPNEIMNGAEKIKIMFIRGFVDSEGGVCNRISITNKNVKLLKSLKSLLISLGFGESHIGLGKSNSRGIYELSIYSKGQFKLYKDKIGFSIKRKQEKLEAAAGI